MGLSPAERHIVELIRKAERIKISVNYYTTAGVQDIELIIGGRVPHDVALAVQAQFTEARQENEKL